MAKRIRRGDVQRVDFGPYGPGFLRNQICGLKQKKALLKFTFQFKSSFILFILDLIM